MIDAIRFDGRTAVVTGAGRGLGAAHAHAFASRGANVVVNDLDGDGASEIVSQIERLGGSAVVSTGSVATEDGARAIVNTALQTFGSLDVLVNNAGVAKAVPFPDEDLDGFMHHLSVHLAGSFNTTRAAWPHMMSRGHGRIVMTSSSAIFGIANHLSYATAKAGLIGLVKSVAAAAGDLDIKVNAIAPRASTRMSSGSFTAPDGRTMPVPPPEQVSPLVLFLAHSSCNVSGETFGTGGGRIDRIVLGATQGWVVEPVTPETVRDDFGRIHAFGDIWIPADCMEHANQLWAGGSAPVMVDHRADATSR